MRIFHTQSQSNLANLPTPILHRILDLVYLSTNTSLTYPNLSRPYLSHDKLQEFSFEHRITSTRIIRSVCQSFHSWALENILCGHRTKRNDGRRVEIDCSNFEIWITKFGSTINEVFQELFKSFPYLSGSGVVLYLENTFMLPNAVLEQVLQSPACIAFEGFSVMDRPCIGHNDKKSLGWPLKTLRKCEKLDVRMPVCSCTFEGIDDDNDNEIADIPNVRNWIVRGTQASSPCLVIPTTTNESQSKRKSHIRTGHAQSLLSFRPDWDEVSIKKLMDSCRGLRSRYEEKTKGKAEWNIEIHLSVLVGDKIGGFCVHDLVFRPLERPPIVVLESCGGRECDGRVIGEEECMEIGSC